jgi:hypothetical protein
MMKSVLIAMVLALASIPGTVFATDTGFEDFPRIVAVDSRSDSIFTAVPGTVTVNNPRSTPIVGNISFETMSGAPLMKYLNFELKPGKTDFMVPLRKMGDIRMAMDVYKYPQYSNDGYEDPEFSGLRATTGTSVGMPKEIIEPMIDATNQIDAPVWHGGSYLKRGGAMGSGTMF